MKVWIAAVAAAAAALVAASMLGVAGAESTSPAPMRTVTVGGVAQVPVAQGASAASATAVYRQAMAAAVADGQSKAEFLASKTAATLGPVQSVVENGGSISCTSEPGGYQEYEGEQPDFPINGGVRVLPAQAVSGAAAPTVKPKPRRRHKTTAKKASVGSCTLQAGVQLVYAIG